MFYTLFIITSICIRHVQADAQGCKPRSVGTAGFDMSLYGYGYYNPAAGPGWCFSSEYEKYDYQHGGYLTYSGGNFGSATGITDVSLAIYPPELCTPYVGTLPPNFNYNEEFTISNFTMLLTGYFRPEVSGNYTFTLKADDLAYLSFGAGNAFDCCGETESVSDPGGFDLIVIWRAADDMSGTVTYNLEAGVYYPLRLLYANRDFYGVLSLTFEDPLGVVHNDFTDHIFQFPDEVEGCANEVKTTTIVWTGTYTTTYSTTVYTSIGTDGFGTVETIYYVETPEPVTSSTTYQGGTFSETRTVSTYTHRTVGGDERTTIETVYVVETPEPQTSSTSYTGGSVTATTTASTYTTHFVGTDGITTTETVYVVETPEPQTSSTSYTGGSVTATTTTSTYTTHFVGTDGITTTETVYVVETPQPQTSSTSYTGGSVTVTTTTSTYTTHFVGTDGITTTETVYIVETPLPQTSRTTFTDGSVSFTTTISTFIEILTASNSDSTIQTVYVVETPKYVTPSSLMTSSRSSIESPVFESLSVSTGISPSTVEDSSVSLTSDTSLTFSMNIPTSEKDISLSLTIKGESSTGVFSRSLDAESRTRAASSTSQVVDSLHSAPSSQLEGPSSRSTTVSTISSTVIQSISAPSSELSSISINPVTTVSSLTTVNGGSSSGTVSFTSPMGFSSIEGYSSSILKEFSESRITSRTSISFIFSNSSISSSRQTSRTLILTSYSSIQSVSTSSTAVDVPPGVSFSDPNKDSDPTASVISPPISSSSLDAVATSGTFQSVSTPSTTADVPPGVSFSDPIKDNDPTDSIISGTPSSSSSGRSSTRATVSITSVSATVTVSSKSLTETQSNTIVTESTVLLSSLSPSSAAQSATTPLSSLRTSSHGLLTEQSSSGIFTSSSNTAVTLLHSQVSSRTTPRISEITSTSGSSHTIEELSSQSVVSNNTRNSYHTKTTSKDSPGTPSQFQSSVKVSTSAELISTVISGRTTVITTTNYVTVGCNETDVPRSLETLSVVVQNSKYETNIHEHTTTGMARSVTTPNEGRPTTTSRLSTIITPTTFIAETISSNDNTVKSNVDIYYQNSLSPKDTTVKRPHGTGQAKNSVTPSTMATHTSSPNSDIQIESFGSTSSGLAQFSGSSTVHTLPSSPVLANAAAVTSNTFYGSLLTFACIFIIML